MSTCISRDVSPVSFTRPADATAYASGDIVANSVTAGSVVPLNFPNVSNGIGQGCPDTPRSHRQEHEPA
jgi:hypothetical protein